MIHFKSVFANSCVRRPVDPISKMPKTNYERRLKQTLLNNNSSNNSTSTICSPIDSNIDTEKVKEFYQSIPDYDDINHLTPDEFYLTLQSLRDKKDKMLNRGIINHNDYSDNYGINSISPVKHIMSDAEECLRGTRSISKKSIDTTKVRRKKEPKVKLQGNTSILLNDNSSNKCYIKGKEVDKENAYKKEVNHDIKASTVIYDKEETLKPKRNYSACSISWNDCKIKGDEIDSKFDRFFDGKRYNLLSSKDKLNKSRSMPTSPTRIKLTTSPSLGRRKSITIPKPFKMTERDEDDRMVNQLRSIQKSFSDDMLHRKCERKNFKARPVPIESRIPLYDKILEDQAMRRAITKMNSEAELQAQMKLFSFTKREESGSRTSLCERAVHSVPKPKKKKRFRARPVPRNLFSNYIYDKYKEDEFFRSMKRRIRAEELLRKSTLPSGMAARESRMSTPAAHSDLPMDPSPIALSASPSDHTRVRSPNKDYRRDRTASRHDYITTSPQPFKFNTADRAAKKILEATKKIYQCDPRSSISGVDSGAGRAYSALDLRSHSTGRSNLAALLRVENVKRRFEMEASNNMAERQRRVELRLRDHQLRSKPAWHLVKNNHEEDIAMRLQTRRDEERMRREEFLHEMELMYGRVQEQPLLFERYYAPRSRSAPSDCLQLSPRKSKRRSSRQQKSYHFNTPSVSRKVSINENPGAFRGVMSDYMSKLYSDSEIATESLDCIK